MNYILLSGGSGKRLWPLSNDIRSKQFIKILKRPDGILESMVERVYRQINNIDKSANITIATSESQVPQIKNQLGDNVDISVEPSRRDTFPAIALACMYLKDNKNINENETVVISPVDPYVSDDYFDALVRLNNMMKSSSANIGLIGIKPTYPSEKYGYIILDNSKVKEFKEKPDEVTARKYITNGALWNGGVFCFKLKYIIDKIHKIIDFIDYNDLYSKYEKLEKISFDYAIVEKEKNIEVLEYDGDWKDIGTWNTLTEVMKEKTIGDSIIDSKSKNSNIINELNIPIIGMGLNNIIIAASPDGIFVSDKHESSYNKQLVEKLNERPMYEERLWGDFKILDMHKNSLVKHLTIKAGKSISYQKHKYRDEVWTIVDGDGIFVLDDVERNVKSGETLIIKKGQKHALKAITNIHFIEVQIGIELSEDDIERFEYNF